MRDCLLFAGAVRGAGDAPQLHVPPRPRPRVPVALALVSACAFRTALLVLP